MDLNIEKSTLRTPCYVYDMGLLNATLQTIKESVGRRPVDVHYAIKANFEPELLRVISGYGFGADCVSIGEIKHSIACGFPTEKIVYAGVGKTDEEIEEAIDLEIGCFNVESLEEIDIIAEIAARKGKRQRVALRINPDIDAHTHHYITTGLAENKFGIDQSMLHTAVRNVERHDSLDFAGLHFHIGSQILTMEPFKILCERINRMSKDVERIIGRKLQYINVGGGLGIDYDDPDANPIADFKHFFGTIAENLELDPSTRIHCELGRSIVGQCGSLLSRVIYVKNGLNKRFAIIDAGMNNLVRPALYGAYHKIEKPGQNVDTVTACYDVVGPICESADCFGENVSLPELKRGDLIAIRSAGAYGQSMSSNYNMRPLTSKLFI